MLEEEVALKTQQMSPATHMKPKPLAEPGSAQKFQIVKDKLIIPSFLDGFATLSEDDLEIMAEFEEEQRRTGHFELVFPTRDAIDSLGPYFES